MFSYNDLSNLDKLKGMSIPSLLHILFYSILWLEPVSECRGQCRQPALLLLVVVVVVNRLSNFGRQPSKANETAVGGINNPFSPNLRRPYLVAWLAGADGAAGAAPPRPPSARKKSIVELRTLAGVGAAAGVMAAGPFGFCFSTIIKLSSLLAGNSTTFVVAAADAASGASSAEVGFKGRPVTSGVAAGLADGSGTTAGAAAGFGE